MRFFPHRSSKTLALCLMGITHAAHAGQAAIWTFPTLSGLSSGSSVNATTETLTGTPTATIRNSTIYASGQTGVAYTDAAGVAQSAGKAIGWSDFKKSGQAVDGQLDLAFNAGGQSGMVLRFDYKHDHDSDNGENEMQWLVSTNGGTSWSAATRFTITDSNTWKSKTITLPASIDGQSSVIVRLEKYSADSNATEVNDILLFDNIELTSGTSGGGGQGPVITVTSSSASVPSTNPVALCGAISDAADAARTAITLSPADADTADANLTATITSSAPSVATGSLTRQTSGGQDTFGLILNPLSVGYANITVTISDPQAHSATYTVNYAVSAASSTPALSSYHAGASDGSSAIALDANWMLVANDEDQVFRLYDRNHSGQPAKTFDLNANLNLAKEADFEASVRFGNRIYLIGSHGNDKEGNAEPTRNISCSYDVSGTGTATTLTYVNKFTNLKANLISWDNSNGHGLGSAALGLSASAATGVLPTDPQGFNIEAATQRGTQVLLGFRAPLQNKTSRNKALVIPVTNFQSVVDAGSGTMQFGSPVFLDLGGRAIRSMATTPAGKILILAGPVGDSSSLSFMFYSWDGNAASAPKAITSSLNTAASNGGGSPEAIVDPPADLVPGVEIQIIQDNGTTVFYNDGITGKDLATRAYAKSRSDKITLTNLPDEIAPVLSLPSNLSREATAGSGAVVSFAVSAQDAVDGSVTATATPASGSVFPLGTTTVNVTTSDAAGNIASGSFTVTVSDTTAPAINLPSNISAEAGGPLGANVNYTLTATDLVDASPSVTTSKPSGSTFPLGTTTVSVTATDDHGNTATGSFTVTVSDTTVPSIHLPPNITMEATGSTGAVVSYILTATDLVDTAPSVTTSKPSGSTFPLGTTTVSVTATDDHGNTATGSFTVTVSDTTIPTINLPANITMEATGTAGAVVSYSVTATDLVDTAPSVTTSKPSGSTFPLGTTTVSVTATDDHNNAATGSFTVTIVDTTPSSIEVPADIVVEAGSADGAVVNFPFSASDLVDGSPTVTASPASGSLFPLGDTIVTVSATDDAGNLSTGSFKITVADTTAPSLVLPSDITTTATSPSGAVVSYAISAGDLVDGAMIPAASAISGTVFPPGLTIVQVSATDSAGNTATGSFNVTVTTAPRIEIAGPDGSPLPDGPASLDLGESIVGSTGTPLFFTIRNSGTANLMLGSVTISSGQSGDFSTVAPASAQLAPGATTTLGVAFSPLAEGARASLLQIASNDPDEARSVFDISLSGTGKLPEPLSFKAAPVIVPPSPSTAASFSALVQGKPNGIVFLEASTDFGLTDPWSVIGQITLDNSGNGQFINITDPGVSAAAPSDFFRLRAE